jgi:uncharacterized membrane protein
MLIVFPVGLLIFSLVCALISTRSVDPVAFYTMVGGFIGALVAAVPGSVDLLSLADIAIKKTAITHMSINLVAVALYALNIGCEPARRLTPGCPSHSPWWGSLCWPYPAG